MPEIKLPSNALNMDIVAKIKDWVYPKEANGDSGNVGSPMRVLIVAGPTGAAKRQHVLAGIYGTNAWPQSKIATADATDSSGENNFLIRTGLTEIDFGHYAGNYRRSATASVNGAIQALSHQRRIRETRQAANDNPSKTKTNSKILNNPVILFRNAQSARDDCVLAALNNAALGISKVIILTERPTVLTYITAAWKTDVILMGEQEGKQKQVAESWGYSHITSHDQKAKSMAENAASVLSAKAGCSVPAIRKLTTDLLKDQHDPCVMAMMILEELERKSKCSKLMAAQAIKKLIDGIENGYRLNLHLEMFLASVACLC